MFLAEAILSVVAGWELPCLNTRGGHERVMNPKDHQ